MSNPLSDMAEVLECETDCRPKRSPNDGVLDDLLVFRWCALFSRSSEGVCNGMPSFFRMEAVIFMFLCAGNGSQDAVISSLYHGEDDVDVSLTLEDIFMDVDEAEDD